MQNVFRQFGARDTGSFNDRYSHSIYKLTFLYAVILASILIVSSGVIYQSFSTRLNSRYRNLVIVPQPTGGVVVGELQRNPTREQLKADLIYSLVLVNGLLVLLATVLSYWLAKTTLRPLRDSYQRQRDFMADASHELRTPLSVLKLELENTINNPSISGAIKQQAVSNMEEVDRMALIVNDLLLLSRLGEGRVEQGSVTMVNLSAFTKGIVDRLQPLASEHSVNISIESTDSEIMLSSKIDLLDQAISNVIKNAVVYNKPNGSVKVFVSKKSKQAVVSIEDTGIGIAKDEQDKVFDRFYRGDKSRSRKSGGSGLGLAIVRSAMDQLHGSIKLHSEPEVGTTITLVFPLA